MKEELLKKIHDELTIDELAQMAKDVNCCNGELDELNYYDNDDWFFEEMFQGRVIEAVRAVCYGSYSYMDEYVRFDGYGNLESCNQFEYEEEIEDRQDEIIEKYVKNIDEMWDKKLNKKINDLMEEEDETINS